ncbi:MAG: glycosyltransferase family 2 protein [Nitrospiraceae bacterium]
MTIGHTTRPTESSDVSSSDSFLRGRPAGDCPLVSVIMPAFNEAAMLGSTLATVSRYMDSLQNCYRWELIVVNDGSADRTGELAEEFAASRSGVRVVHHPRNCGLGQALRSGFNSSLGEYVVVLDSDLSYAPSHIGLMLDQIRISQAKVVVASPYAKGGKVSYVPWLRRVMSAWANRFLSSVARCSLSTLTGMVRVYDGRFIRALSLRSVGMEVSPEIIYKSLLLRAQIDEIPAHLDWKLQRAVHADRTSSMKVLPHILSTVFTGFIFSPFLFFLLPGLALLTLAVYTNVWMVVHFYDHYQTLTQYDWFFTRASVAVGQAYQAFPHTFIVGGLSSMLAIQLISLGVLSLQSKQYFEEIFHLSSAMYQYMRERPVTGRHVDQETD